jgi:hypothetical protein
LVKTVSRAGPQPVNNETVIDRSTIKPEVRRELLVSTSKFKNEVFSKSFSMSAGEKKNASWKPFFTALLY